MQRHYFVCHIILIDWYTDVQSHKLLKMNSGSLVFQDKIKLIVEHEIETRICFIHTKSLYWAYKILVTWHSSHVLHVLCPINFTIQIIYQHRHTYTTPTGYVDLPRHYQHQFAQHETNTWRYGLYLYCISMNNTHTKITQ